MIEVLDVASIAQVSVDSLIPEKRRETTVRTGGRFPFPKGMGDHAENLILLLF